MKLKTPIVLYKLFALIKALLFIIVITIIMGTFGFISSMSLTILGTLSIAKLLGAGIAISYKLLITLILIAGFTRGIARYIEHYTGHYVAFRLLAILRDKLFFQLRILAPAKLDQKEKGRLISMISSDIETLEVFYAHTIAPIIIAFNISILIIILISSLASIYLGLIALITSLVMGIILPIIFSRQLKTSTDKYRESFGRYSEFLLDNILGIKDLSLLGATKDRTRDFLVESELMETSFRIYKKKLSVQKIITDFLIYFFVVMMLIFAGILYQAGVNPAFTIYTVNIKNTFGSINLVGLLIATIGLLTSFGPLLALINLPTSLNFSINSGQRLLNLLDEKPVVKELTTGSDFVYKNLSLENISFSFDTHNIIKNLSLNLDNTGIIGIYGDSGSGKSTILKLIMRFYDTNYGDIKFNNQSIKKINSESIRANVGYIMQDTHIFNETLAYNLSFCDKTEKSLLFEALEKTGLDNLFTDESEILGNKARGLSQGEKQRLGLSRIFLHNKPLILLDEPTSNIDILNESIILNTLKEASKTHMIILVTHKESTLSICNKIYELHNHELILKS